jgi:hypothetical protein
MREIWRASTPSFHLDNVDSPSVVEQITKSRRRVIAAIRDVASPYLLYPHIPLKSVAQRVTV